MGKIIKTIIIGFFLINSFFLNVFPQKAIELIQKMIDEEAKIKSMKVTMIMNERINGKMKEKKADFKISYNPFKIFLKQEYPQKGMEILYVEGENDGKAWVNTNSMPWITISIRPNSKTMRKDYHHSIFNSGYQNFSKIVSYLINKNFHNIDDLLTYEGIKTITGIKCHQIIYANKEFGYFDYKVNKNILLSELANRFYVNDYMLKDKNPGIIDFDEVKAGKTIKIPSDYGKKVIINLDVNSYLPRSIHVYDEKGLYEEYYFSNIVINPTFTTKDFDPENEAYIF